MRRLRGAWAQMRAGMHDAVVPFRRLDRRLRVEREAERIFEMSPALLAVAGFDGYLRRSTRRSSCSATRVTSCCRGRGSSSLTLTIVSG